MIQFQPKETIAPAPSRHQAIVSSLADTMREMAFAGEAVSPDTLANHGYSREIVERFGERATALARRRSIKQVNSHA